MSDTGSAVGAPNWETFAGELRCPRCGYDVRMLPQPRCPECGLQFDWAELITAAKIQAECPLFEYQWRRRPVRSFIITVLRAMLPWRLWARTSVTWDPQVLPLFALAVTALIGHFICSLGVDYAWYEYAWRQFSALIGRARPMSTWSTIDFAALTCEAPGYVLLGLFVWLSLQIYQQTISRYRLRKRQLLRVIVGALVGAVAWQAVTRLFALGLAVARAWLQPSQPIFYVSDPPRYTAYGDIIPWVILTFSLCLALGTYLKVRRGWLLGLASQLIVLLALVAPMPAIIVSTGTTNCAWERVLVALWPGMRHIMRALFFVA